MLWIIFFGGISSDWFSIFYSDPIEDWSKFDCAPKQQKSYKSRFSSKKLADISIALFTSPIALFTSPEKEKWPRTGLWVHNWCAISSHNWGLSCFDLQVGACAIVDLSNNLLTGSLSAIQNWGNRVEVVHLSSYFLTGTLPSGTYQFLRLTSIKISNNSLNVPLPLVMGSFPVFNVIDLSINRLSGPLPVRFFASFWLTDLNLSQNSFTRPIPLKTLKKNYLHQHI